MKNKITIAIGGLGLLLAGIAVGQGIDQRRTPNLFAAQQYCEQAKGALVAAQSASHEQLAGHAENAKRLITQAEGEIQAASQFAEGGR